MTLLACVALVLLLPLARAQGTVDSYESLVAAVIATDGTTFRLVPGRRYVLSTPLTIGLASFTLESADADSSLGFPILSCAAGVSSALVVEGSAEVVLANLAIEGCSGPAVALRSPAAAQPNTSWRLTNVTFSRNGAKAPPLQAPLAGALAFTASGLLAQPPDGGSLALSGCAFLSNGGPAGAAPAPHATPALAVMCAAGCALAITDTSFTGNTGTQASALLLQTLGSARVNLSRAVFSDNTAAWQSSPRPPRLGSSRFPVPAAAALHLLFSPSSAPAATVAIELHDTTFRNNTNSHGLAVLRLPELNHPATALALTASNASFTDHTSGPSALLAVGLRRASIAGLVLTGNAGDTTIATTTASGAPSSSRLLSSGSSACLALEDEGPGLEGGTAEAELTDAAVYDNAVVDSGALYVTTVGRLLRANFSRSGRLTLTNLTATGQRASRLGQAVMLSAVGEVRLEGGLVARNAVGGGLAIEYSDSAELSGVVFSGNARVVQADALGVAIPASGQGGGLWLTNSGGGAAAGSGGGAAGVLLLRGCRFEGNTAATAGGAAYFDTLGELRLEGCNATDNAAPGGDGGAFRISNVATLSLTGGYYTRNTASGHGGALAVQDCGRVDAANLTLHDNTAGGSGGAAFLTHSTQLARFSFCDLSNNTALDGSSSAAPATSATSASLGAAPDSIIAPGSGGGGAVAGADLADGMQLYECSLSYNSAPYASGGAISVRNAQFLSVHACSLHANAAGASGGAVRLSNMASVQSSVIGRSELTANVAGRAAASVPQSPGQGQGSEAEPGERLTGAGSGSGSSSGSGGGELAPGGGSSGAQGGGQGDAGDTGLGGAVYLEASILTVLCARLAGNVARSGGAIHARLESRLALLGGQEAGVSGCPPLAVLPAVPRASGAAAGTLYEPYGSTAVMSYNVSYATVFEGNAAMAGGALYVRDSTLWWAGFRVYDAPGYETWRRQGVLFANNTASTGGAALLYAVWDATLRADFVSNAAEPAAAAAAVAAALRVPAAGLAAAAGAGAGAGGALAVVGSGRTRLRVSASAMLYNTAVDGGAVHLSCSEACAAPEGCYSAQLVGCVLAGNAARGGGGGGVFWEHPGLLAVACAAPPEPPAPPPPEPVEVPPGASGDGGSESSGWHDVDFAATSPFRELSASGMTVFVRPCAIGEYLSPAADQCVPCSPGYWNLDHTAPVCRPCAASALCAEPDQPGSIIVPGDGAWHSNFFSEQVHDCPNADACTYENRTAVLSGIQQQASHVLELSRHIQATLVIRPNATAPLASASAAPAASADNGGGQAGAAGGGTGPARRALLQAASGTAADEGRSPYGPAYDDTDYAQLLQSIGALSARYSAAMCAEGYTGVLCGSCAAGFGSTGPAQCRACPPPAYNAAYYCLALGLTLVILAWTIRSLLTQSLAAAAAVRDERKVEVLGEMRLMGRPLLHPRLMAALDDDELPDLAAAGQPFYGAVLPPSLEGLAALRLAYHHQLERHNSMRLQQQQPHQQQQQPYQQQQDSQYGQHLTHLNSRRHSYLQQPPQQQVQQQQLGGGGIGGGFPQPARQQSYGARQSYGGSMRRQRPPRSPSLRPPLPPLWARAAAAVVVAAGGGGGSLGGSRGSSGSRSGTRGVRSGQVGLEAVEAAGEDGVGAAERTSAPARWAGPVAEGREEEGHEEGEEREEGGREEGEEREEEGHEEGEAGEGAGERQEARREGRGQGEGLRDPRDSAQDREGRGGPVGARLAAEVAARRLRSAQTQPARQGRSGGEGQTYSPRQGGTAATALEVATRAASVTAAPPPPQQRRQDPSTDAATAGRKLAAAAQARPALLLPHRMSSGGGAAVLAVSPRTASATGMPSGFLAEVLRRQKLAPLELPPPPPEPREGPLPPPREEIGAGSAAAASGPDAACGDGGGGSDGTGSGSCSLSKGQALRDGAAPTAAGVSPTVRGLGLESNGAVASVSRNRLEGGGGVGKAGGGAGSGWTDMVAATWRGGGGGTARWAGSFRGGGSTTARWSYSFRGGGGEVEEWGLDSPAGEPERCAPWGGRYGSGAPPAPSGGGGGGAANSMRAGGPDARPLQDAAAIKIFIAYVQILALVKAVPIPRPPKSVLAYLRFYDQITAIPGSLVSLDCSLPGGSGGPSRAMQRTILAATAPFYVSVVVAAAWVVLMLRAMWRERWSMNRLEEVSLVVIMVTLYLNLYFMSPDVAFAGRTALAAVIIGLNAAMLAAFAWVIAGSSWEKQLDTMGLDWHRVYDMEEKEIQASLRHHYGPRTAAVLTCVVTSAQAMQAAKVTPYATKSVAMRAKYSAGLESGLYRPDPRQQLTIQMLQALYDDLQRAGAAHQLANQHHRPVRRRPSGLTIVDYVGGHYDDDHAGPSGRGSSSSGGGGGFSWFSGWGGGGGTAKAAVSAADTAPAVRGLYMYGGVGCGKTMLMDLFVHTAPTHFKARPAGRGMPSEGGLCKDKDNQRLRGTNRVFRTHYHDFMLEVHAALRRSARKADPLAAVADGIVGRCRVLALDELFVTDVADAMILNSRRRARAGGRPEAPAGGGGVVGELHRMLGVEGQIHVMN
ncbi:hypothetical protein TSOC_007159 [Tetrabaena socialis]|uniref:Right handed beta helix domain-containing protein n=1 Tax=Tetrabaena socialis TaxID=47790 RepID=A0A2J8A1X8_9CHLO|nr:hypothetical protein TSOC_007159 [Tetrabaena socialis]|eukprot:PNH06517.1 hypothetical protein TSOC_007159 [Tetrabaena socialis]